MLEPVSVTEFKSDDLSFVTLKKIEIVEEDLPEPECLSGEVQDVKEFATSVLNQLSKLIQTEPFRSFPNFNIKIRYYMANGDLTLKSENGEWQIEYEPENVSDKNEIFTFSVKDSRIKIKD